MRHTSGKEVSVRAPVNQGSMFAWTPDVNIPERTDAWESFARCIIFDNMISISQIMLYRGLHLERQIAPHFSWYLVGSVRISNVGQDLIPIATTIGIEPPSEFVFCLPIIMIEIAVSVGHINTFYHLFVYLSSRRPREIEVSTSAHRQFELISSQHKPKAIARCWPFASPYWVLGSLSLPRHLYSHPPNTQVSSRGTQVFPQGARRVGQHPAIPLVLLTHAVLRVQE